MIETQDDKKIKILDTTLITFASELTKLDVLFHKLISKVDFEDQKKYLGQFSWFMKKAGELLTQSHISLVLPEQNSPFDTGLPVTALNIEDFSPTETLVIDRVIEPIVMKNNQVIKTGTVLLKRGE